MSAGDVVGQETTRHAFIQPGLNSAKYQDTGNNYVNSVIGDIDSWITAGGSSATSTISVVRGVGGTVGTNGTSNIEVRHSRYTAPNVQPTRTGYLWERTA